MFLRSSVRRLLGAAVLLAGMLAAALPARAVSPNVVISQVYGGGGNTGAPYNSDYIELFNRGDASVSLDGWSLQYASAAGTGNFGSAANLITPLSGSLQPGQYLLVQEAGGANGVALPTPDVTDGTPISMSATGGKVALVSSSASLGCNGGSNACSASALALIVDLIGYDGANFFEGSAAAPTLSSSTAGLRRSNGCVDTDENSADITADIPAPRNSASPLSPCSADSAPEVSGTTPASSAINVPVDSPLTIAFSEPVDLSGSWLTIACATSGAHTATVSGGPSSFTIDPDTDFAASESCTVTVSAALVSDQDTVDPPDTLATDYSWSFTTAAANPCVGDFTPIYDLQGTGSASPFAGQAKITEGVVAGDFQGSSRQSGFYIQDASGDGNPLSSDGIFVYVPAANALSSIDVSVGDLVRVSGRVVEFNTLTEIDTVTTLNICGSGSVAPTAVSLPEQTNGDLERYEDMLVTFPQELTVGQNYYQGRYGQITLGVGRLPQATNVYTASSPEAQAQLDLNARSLLVLDDGTTSQNPAPIPYIGLDNTLRAGDTVTGVTGLLDYGPINSDTSIRDYRVQPTQAPTFTRVNQRTSAPASVGGSLKVASFNVLNYFNGDGQGGGFPTSRGAETPVEFGRQRAKIIQAILVIDPDIAGLMEMENDGDGQYSAVQDLVNGLNDATAPGTYAVAAAPAPGTDVIRVAMIYKPASVSPVGAAVNYQVSDPVYGAELFDRPPLAQTFAQNSTGAKLTVIVNHFKSKSSCPSSGVDTDQGDGQGCWNPKRVRQAQEFLSFVADRQAAAGDDDVLVIGDLNSYGMEDPIQVLTSGGLIDQIKRFIGAGAYSYVFDGVSGYLDHALASASLSPQVTGVAEWHINADEPSIIDYNTNYKQNPDCSTGCTSPDLYTPTPYRASDHDPVIIGLNLNAAPSVSAGGPYSVPEGGSVALTASGSDPNAGDTLSYAWDLDNNGSFETTGQTVTFSAAGRDGPSSQLVKVRVSDAGGLSALAESTVAIENAAPSVGAPSVSVEPSIKGQSVVASASFSDPGPSDAPFSCAVDYGDGSGALAGVVSGSTCTGPAHSYAQVGSYTVGVSVQDKDGAVGSGSAAHQVIYKFKGFYAPIDNPPAVNPTIAGLLIPLAFSLDGYQGSNIIASGYPQVQPVSCSTGAPTGAAQAASPTGSSGLVYDIITKRYVYVWKTERSWARGCRQLIIKLKDGTEHSAIFKFY